MAEDIEFCERSLWCLILMNSQPKTSCLWSDYLVEWYFNSFIADSITPCLIEVWAFHWLQYNVLCTIVVVHMITPILLLWSGGLGVQNTDTTVKGGNRVRRSAGRGMTNRTRDERGREYVLFRSSTFLRVDWQSELQFANDEMKIKLVICKWITLSTYIMYTKFFAQLDDLEKKKDEGNETCTEYYRAVVTSKITILKVSTLLLRNFSRWNQWNEEQNSIS